MQDEISSCTLEGSILIRSTKRATNVRDSGQSFYYCQWGRDAHEEQHSTVVLSSNNLCCHWCTAAVTLLGWWSARNDKKKTVSLWLTFTPTKTFVILWGWHLFTASQSKANCSYPAKRRMYLLYTVIAGLICFLILKWMKRRRYCTDVKRLDGKTALITGKKQPPSLILIRRLIG